MITRLLALQVILLLGLSSMFLLPKQPKRPAPGVAAALPEYLGFWYGEPTAVSDKERQVLGAETQFDRRVYSDGRGNKIFVSIVFAGQDMNTSIHRPERCLPAQGYTLLDSSARQIDLSPHPLTITRLKTQRPLSLPGDAPRTETTLNYYWFIGCSETTPSHTARNLIDIRDRLFKGYNQPWAYVTVTCSITKGNVLFGLSEEETDGLLRDFLKKLVPAIESPAVVNS